MTRIPRQFKPARKSNTAATLAAGLIVFVLMVALYLVGIAAVITVIVLVLRALGVIA